MENIKISVIIPIYNAELYLDSCLDSLFIQTYKNIEFICVNDGSKDNSLEICQKYAAKDERFVIIDCKKNLGPSSARNLAISKARGEYLCFVDSDDMVRYGTYEKLSALSEKTNADLIVFGANLIPENPPEHFVHLTSPRDVCYDSFSPQMLFDEVGSRPFLWMHMIRKSIIVDNALTLDTSIDLGEDQLFQFHYLPLVKKAVYTSEKFYVYRWQRKDSLMAKYSKKYEKKISLHVKLVEKILSYIYTSFKDDDDMLTRAFGWSIFFMYHDIANFLAETQIKIASALVEVWEKLGCFKYFDALNDYAQNRVLHLQTIIRDGYDYDKKITIYKDEIQKLNSEIAELRNHPKYKKSFEKVYDPKKESLIHKFFKNLKQKGIKVTIKKIFLKLSGKL